MTDVIAPPADKAGDEHAAPVDAVVDDDFFDHLPDRQRLPAIPLGVLGLEPVEAAVGIVGALLLGQQQGEAIAVGERRPPCPEVITGRGLGAAVQHHHERGIGGKRGRQIAEHSQVPGIRSEAVNLLQSA